MKTLALKVFMVLISSLYLWLPILGWGGFAPYCANPARVAVTLICLAAIIASICTQGNLSQGVQEDKSNRWVLIPLIGLGTVAGYLPALTDRLSFWSIDGDTCRWIGAALFGIGCMLRIWPVFVLANRFSGLVAIQPDHKLVTSGIYKIIRHPSYLGMIVMGLGWALAFRSVIGVGLALLMLPPLLARIKSEEKLLLSHFGAEYEDFRAQTKWRLIPGVY